MENMLLIPFISALLIILLILFSPCILKSLYKNKKFFGYGLGFCCFIVTNIINFLILFISFIIIGLYSKDKLKSIINSQNSSGIFNLEGMLLNTEAKIFFSVIYSLLNINIFLMTFKFTKTLANQQYIYNVIFTFISGYLLPYVFPYLGFIYLSFNSEEIDREMSININSNININNNTFILLFIELIVAFQIFGFMGTAIMLFLHQKRKNNCIIWLCVISFFSPVIIFIIGLLLIKKTEILFLTFPIFDLISLLFGTIFYCKYADSNQNGDLHMDFLLQPNSAIIPPY